MLYKFLREIQQEKKNILRVGDLAKRLQISSKHLSNYFNGKAGMTSEKEWALIEAMEELAPGSRIKLGVAIAGEMNADETAMLIELLVQNFRSDRSKQKENVNVTPDLLAVS